MPPKFTRELESAIMRDTEERERLLNPEGATDDDDLIGIASSSTPGLSIQDKKLKRVQFKVDEVTEIMRDNIDKVMERGDRLQDLEDKSEVLTSHAEEFRSTAQKMQRRMWLRNVKMRIILAVLIVGVILIIVVPIIVRSRSS